MARSRRPIAPTNPFNQEPGELKKQFESAGPTKLNNPYKVPFELNTKRTQPEYKIGYLAFMKVCR